MNIRAKNENKCFERDLMNLVEARNGLPNTNYRGRKGMNSEMKAANNVITFELFRQERRIVSSCIANQKLAHYLVVHYIDILQCIRQGSDPGRTLLAFYTLWNLATMIKTNFGTDMEAAGGTYDLFAVDLNRPRHQHSIPLQGLGQGNG